MLTSEITAASVHRYFFNISIKFCSIAKPVAGTSLPTIRTLPICSCYQFPRVKTPILPSIIIWGVFAQSFFATNRQWVTGDYPHPPQQICILSHRDISAGPVSGFTTASDKVRISLTAFSIAGTWAGPLYAPPCAHARTTTCGPCGGKRFSSWN